jgi:hypothetical protein
MSILFAASTYLTPQSLPQCLGTSTIVFPDKETFCTSHLRAVAYFRGGKGSGVLAIAARDARVAPPRGDAAAERPRPAPNNVCPFLRMFARRRQQLGTTVAGTAS